MKELIKNVIFGIIVGLETWFCLVAMEIGIIPFLGWCIALFITCLYYVGKDCTNASENVCEQWEERAKNWKRLCNEFEANNRKLTELNSDVISLNQKLTDGYVVLLKAMEEKMTAEERQEILDKLGDIPVK